MKSLPRVLLVVSVLPMLSCGVSPGMNGPDARDVSGSGDPSYVAVTPLEGESTSDPTPLLDWADVEGATAYELQLSDSAEGLVDMEPVLTNESRYVVEDPLGIGMWYWRVRAAEPTSDWGSVWVLSVFDSLLEMVPVSGGTFWMGCAIGEAAEQPVHSVTLTGFLIAETEVTRAQWRHVVDSNPPEYYSSPTDAQGSVSWYGAVAFCNALSEMEGLEPCYTNEGTSIQCDPGRNGYRLPTEAEWEYAARGGAASLGYLSFPGAHDADSVALMGGDYVEGGMPVGTKAANELGIYDMAGNLWEWCWDWFGPYSADPSVDPTGPDVGEERVNRGGGFLCDEWQVRWGYRNDGRPDYPHESYGFRPVRRL